jgi:hypothetical protein
VKWRELSGIPLLIPWVWYDFLDTHSFSKLCLLAFSLVIAQGIICSFWGANWKTLSVWLASLLPVAMAIWENSRPEPTPHFTMVLQSATGWKNINLELTNAVLFSEEGHVLSTLDLKGYLVIPVKAAQTNVSLDFTLIPDSPVESDLAEIVMSIPKDVKCHSGEGWSESKFPSANDQYTKSIGSKLDLRFILPNDWITLPELTFALPVNDSYPNAVMPMYVRIRARGMPTAFFGFWVSFPVLTNDWNPEMIIDGNRPTPGIPFHIPYPD